jgi:hypothetical protein
MKKVYAINPASGFKHRIPKQILNLEEFERNLKNS